VGRVSEAGQDARTWRGQVPAPDNLGERALRRRVQSLAGHAETGPLLATIVLFVLFTLWARHFLDTGSIAVTLIIAANYGLVAIPATLLMIAGEFDLSVGSVLGLTAALAPYLMVSHGLTPAAATLVAITCAGLAGLLNGVIVTLTRIPSLIVTLGALALWRGVVELVTSGRSVTVPSDTGVLGFLGHTFPNGINISAIWLVIAIVAGWFLLTRTEFGNHVYAAGGNEHAARVMGIPVDRVRVLLFVATALGAGFAGLVQSARFGSVEPTAGSGLELQIVAAIFIGGTSLRGGRGSVIGVGLGCLSVAMLNNGLALAGVSTYWYDALIGVLTIGAVLINEGIARFAGKARP
jgi:simple sugar transport system permease protein